MGQSFSDAFVNFSSAPTLLINNDRSLNVKYVYIRVWYYLSTCSILMRRQWKKLPDEHVLTESFSTKFCGYWRDKSDHGSSVSTTQSHTHCRTPVQAYKRRCHTMQFFWQRNSTLERCKSGKYATSLHCTNVSY